MRAICLATAVLIVGIAATFALAGDDPATTTTDDGIWVGKDVPQTDDPIADPSKRDADAALDAPSEAGVPVPDWAPGEPYAVIEGERGARFDTGDPMTPDERAAFRSKWGLDDLRAALREQMRAQVQTGGGEPVGPPESGGNPWSYRPWSWGPGFRDSSALPSHRQGYRYDRPGLERFGETWRHDVDAPAWRLRARPRYQGPWPWERDEGIPVEKEPVDEGRSMSL